MTMRPIFKPKARVSELPPVEVCRAALPISSGMAGAGLAAGATGESASAGLAASGPLEEADGDLPRSGERSAAGADLATGPFAEARESLAVDRIASSERSTGNVDLVTVGGTGNSAGGAADVAMGSAGLIAGATVALSVGIAVGVPCRNSTTKR